VPAAGACAGLAMLAKGPLGVLLPALVTVVFVAVARDRDTWRRLAPGAIPAAVAAAVVAGPWYVAILRAQGRAFVDVFLLDHNLARFTSTIHHHPGPFLYYLPILVVGLFMWSGLLVPALGTVSRRRARDLFVLAWAGAPLVFFSLAGSKLPGYILPCVPPLAILAGRAADGLVRGEGGAGLRRAAGLVTVVLAAVAAALPIVAARFGEPAWSLLVPPAGWALLTALFASSRLWRDPGGALAILRVGAAGFLLLLTSAAPPILAHRESGRDLFRAARGREVLAWNAWRTAWMAGYFYNDGRVREVSGLDEIAAAAARGGALVVCGPAELRALQSLPGFDTLVIARGPRGQVLARVQPRLVLRPSS
jgi:4-amino-4-deoxy-L-arabinose transferase-like glycosyltransferase